VYLQGGVLARPGVLAEQFVGQLHRRRIEDVEVARMGGKQRRQVECRFSRSLTPLWPEFLTIIDPLWAEFLTIIDPPA
jgi:hypothetical protein